MDSRPLFQSLAALSEDNAAFFQRRGTELGRRLAAACRALREHGRRMEPALRQLARLCPRFDLDAATPGNGYRSLLQTARCCLAHAVHKSRYVAAHRGSVFFRAAHNLAELEASGAALAQLRALLCLAGRLLAASAPGCLFPPEEAGLGQLVLREYSTMHNGCFYGRCLGFQFAPSLRPLLQAIAIGLVSFGENYKPNDSGLGLAAGSLFTSGKFALDPELRGAEFERLTQNLDVWFWKRFWNLTETELLASLASMAVQVALCRALSVPPEPLELPSAGDPAVTVTIAPPVAHTGPAPINMRLLSYHLREGQDSPALSALCRSEGALPPLRWRRGPPLPPHPGLLLHFHGGGFVAQTSRSHEPYLRGWARDLGAPLLSVDYALAPEAPFPRALEECFYAYCWALSNCRLLGSTAQRVCLAGDSAGGNLCLSVSLRAAALGVRPPHGIVAAYPVTLVQAAASPSRLLTLLDPLLPISVLCQCLRAYAGADGDGEGGAEPPAPPALSPPRQLLRHLRQGAAQWLGGLLRGAPPKDAPTRKSRSEEPPPPDGNPQNPDGNPPNPDGNPQNPDGNPQDADGSPESADRIAQKADGSPQNVDGSPQSADGSPETADFSGFPDEFRPLRSRGPPARFLPPPAPLARNPFMSPLLAPEPLLAALPPLHLVACALDPMLDDSVALARRLRSLGRPVSLRVLPDLPHGFLSLGALTPETRRATELCTRLIRDVLQPPAPQEPRRGSLLLGGRRDSSAPLDTTRRGSPLLGGRRESLAPQDASRRGSVMLGGQRESLAPQDASRRGSVMLGGRRESLAPQDASRRGSVMLGGHRESLAPQDASRRGSVMLGGQRDSSAPQDGLRRGSVLLGGRRDSLAPQDAPRRGSVVLGTHKDTLAPQDAPRRGSVMLGGRRESSAPQESPRRGSVLLGTHRDSSAPLDASHRGSVMLGGHRESLAPQDGLCRGSVMLGGRKDSSAPQDTTRHGSVMLGTHKDSLVTHSAGDVGGPGAAVTHSLGGAAQAGGGGTATHGDGSNLTHSDGSTLPHGTSSILTHSDGSNLTHSDGSTPPHGTSNVLPHSDSSTVTHSNESTVTRGTSNVLTHSDGSTVPHSDGSTVTRGNGSNLTHSNESTLPHGTSNVLPHSDGSTPPHSDGSTLPHSDESTPPPGPSPTPRPPGPAQPHIEGSPQAPPPPPCCGAPPRSPRGPPNGRRPSGPMGREVGS